MALPFGAKAMLKTIISIEGGVLNYLLNKFHEILPNPSSTKPRTPSETVRMAFKKPCINREIVCAYADFIYFLLFGGFKL